MAEIQQPERLIFTDTESG